MNKHLDGKTINKIQIAKDKKAIRFELSSGEVIALCDGDCCSSTWIEHIELPAAGFPALVKESGSLDMGKEDAELEFETIAFYGYKIQTDKGNTDI